MAETKIFTVMDACQLNNKIPLIGFQERYPLSLSHSTIHQKQRLLHETHGSGYRENNNNKEFANEMVNNLLSLFMPQGHNRGCVVLQLVSTQLDPRTKEAKLSKETVLELSKDHKGRKMRSYKVEFLVEPDFGVPGAVTIINGYDTEIFLESISIVQSVNFACKSWVQPKKLNPVKRIFFINKVHEC
ncbi:PLAT/LH2 domain [Sesbania bispinosa]|nr:PLAT/LH2 domain [Sesbania bispinosa]